MKTSASEDLSNLTALFITVCNVFQSPDFLTKVALFRARQESYNSWDNNHFLTKKWMSTSIHECGLIIFNSSSQIIISSYDIFASKNPELTNVTLKM